MSLFVGDPYGRIVQVISLREITCYSCGEALLSPNIPPKGIARQTFRRALRNLRGFDPSGSQQKEHGCCRALCVGEVTDAMSELFFMDSISSEVGMVIGVSSKVRNTLN